MNLNKPTLLLGLSLTALLFSCGGEESATPTPQHTINDISPLSGTKDTEVTIAGTGFNTTAANNKVFFNGVEATVKNATATELVVIVPPKAKDGAVSVSIGGKTASGPAFDYQETYTVSTFAGGVKGSADGTGTAAQFFAPSGITLDAAGNLYVADRGNNMIRKITPAGVVSTLAGSTTSGADDGTGTAARFNDPSSLVSDAAGNLYVADRSNSRIRKITPEGVVSTLAGSNFQGIQDGTGSEAKFIYPEGIARDAAGNLYVSDGSLQNSTIRKVTTAGVVTTFAGGNTLETSKSGFQDGTGAAAKFDGARGLAFDAAGNLFVADEYNNRIRKITPESVVSTFAGWSSGSNDGEGTSAQFKQAAGVAFDAAGNLYVADQLNHRIRKITPTGVVSTIAGSIGGYENGVGTAAKFWIPNSLVVDAEGNIYVTDFYNHAIRKITVE